MAKKMRTFDTFLEDYLNRNPDQIDGYLQNALKEYEKDYDETALLLALLHSVKAKGGMTLLAENTGIPRESLYRMLAPTGNPTLKSLQKILESFGYVLTFKSMKSV